MHDARLVSPSLTKLDIKLAERLRVRPLDQAQLALWIQLRWTPWGAASPATERPSIRCASTGYRAFATGDLPSLGVSHVSTQVSPIY